MEIVGLHVRQDLVEVERGVPATERIALERAGLDEDIGDVGDHVLEAEQISRRCAPHQAKVGVVFEGVFPLDASHEALGLGVGEVGVVRLDQLGQAARLAPVMVRGTRVGLDHGPDLVGMIAQILAACHEHVDNQALDLGTVQDHLDAGQLLGLGNLRLPQHVCRLVGAIGVLHFLEHIGGAVGLDHPVAGKVGQLEVRLDDAGQKLARRTGCQHEAGAGIIQILQRGDGTLVGQHRVRPLGFVDHHHDRRRETAGLGPGHQQGVDRVNRHLHVAILQRLEPGAVVGTVVHRRQPDAF